MKALELDGCAWINLKIVFHNVEIYIKKTKARSYDQIYTCVNYFAYM